MEMRNLLFRFPKTFQGCLHPRIGISLVSHRKASSTSTASSPSATSPTAARNLNPPPLSLGGLSQILNSNEPVRPIEEYTGELSRPKEHHLHVFSTKHNCHLTLTSPSRTTEKGIKRDTIISISCGNIGFRKAARGTYDAAYQLGAYLMNQIQNRGLLREIQRLELVIRGFGPGREALSKILLGVEGAALRPRIVRVVDSTRLKIGGTRSKKARRL